MPSVLIIDDQPAVHELLEGIVEAAGFESARALGGHDALKRYRSRRFDVVLTDLTMQPMDGLTFLKKLKAYDPQARVIIMTGRDNDINERRAKDLGAEAYVRKPFKIADLINLLSAPAPRDSSAFTSNADTRIPAANSS
jgi:CheY-like chemotaxis protein